jgi:4-hydroxybenzoate polyprenyltransferase
MTPDARSQTERPSDLVPICVDLDGTLLRTDLLYESFLALLRNRPWLVVLVPFWLLGGKARLKRRLAEASDLDVADLPYDARVLERLRDAAPRPRVLCTASDERLARAVADHTGVFDEVIASDGATNLSGRRKADALVQRYGERGFDYAGNGDIDVHVWKRARRAWVVNAPARLAAPAASQYEVEHHLPPTAAPLRSWLRSLRLHQWLKNLLVFLPLLASHRFIEPEAVVASIAAFIAFGLCASGVYLLNDLLDLPSDRRHPRKRERPFAAGDLPLLHGLIAAPILTVCSFALAAWVSLDLLLVLSIYLAMTLAYSFRLKRIAMLDVILLAALYTVRIVAGAAAIGSDLSFWLLAFSMFLFLSLAMLKRYTELAAMLEAGKASALGRGYSVEDLPLLQSLGASAGYGAVLVLALYINSPESLALYARPQVLWLVCPLLLYWISRMWIVAHRGGMHDDPVVFAARDRVSQIVVALCGIAAFAAL